MCAHLRHTLFAVFRRGNPKLLDKCAVEGARCIKTDQRTDLCDAERGVEQVSASLGDTQRVDVIVKTQAEPAAEQVGDIKLV